MILWLNLLYSPYARDTAVYPLPWLRERKFWPSVARIDDGEHAFTRFKPWYNLRF